MLFFYSVAADLFVCERCTIKNVCLLCWSTSGRPQLQLRAHMAFNAEHSKLPLTRAWQKRARGGAEKKSPTEAYVRLRQAGDTTCRKATDLNCGLFFSLRHISCTIAQPFLIRRFGHLTTDNMNCEGQGFLFATFSKSHFHCVLVQNTQSCTHHSPLLSFCFPTCRDTFLATSLMATPRQGEGATYICSNLVSGKD